MLKVRLDCDGILLCCILVVSNLRNVLYLISLLANKIMPKEKGSLCPPGGASTSQSQPPTHLCLCVCRPGSSNLTINANHNINIKAEPISPPRDHLSQSYVNHSHAPPHPSSSSSRAEIGRSPADSVNSSCSSHDDASDREEQQQQQQQRRCPDLLSLPAGRLEGRESPTVKRMRMDSWVT